MVNENAFHDAMVGVYRSAKDECGYNATRFLQMVAERGGLATAHHLLSGDDVQTGFEELWEHGRLDLTVENLVLQDQWRGLFSDDELGRARARLLAHGFDPDEAGGTVMTAQPADIAALKSAIERHCLSVHATPVRLNSGGYSNYYLDLKGVTLHPRYAKIIGELMLPAVVESGAEAVGGLAAGCIPIADAIGRAALDAGLTLPTFFGRAEAKDHGPSEKATMRAAATEDGSPLIRPGRKVAIVEDAVTQGGAAMQATQAAQAAGCDVVLVMTVVERHEGGGARFREQGLAFRRLFYTLEDGSLHVDEAVAAHVG